MPPADDRFMTAGGLAKKKAASGRQKGFDRRIRRGANERMLEAYFDESDITTM